RVDSRLQHHSPAAVSAAFQRAFRALRRGIQRSAAISLRKQHINSVSDASYKREGRKSMANTHFYDTEVGWMGARRGYLRSSADLPVLELASPPEFQGHEHTWTPEHLFVASVNSCY